MLFLKIVVNMTGKDEGDRKNDSSIYCYFIWHQVGYGYSHKIKKAPKGEVQLDKQDNNKSNENNQENRD